MKKGLGIDYDKWNISVVIGDTGYSRNASCVLNLISTFLFIFVYIAIAGKGSRGKIYCRFCWRWYFYILDLDKMLIYF
jgi:hypothetical protein